MSKSSASNFIVILVLAMVVSQCVSQTFHYSHGWTNGKRSGPPPSLGSNSFRPESPYKSELLQLLNEVEPLKPVNIESPLILLPVSNGGQMASYKLYTMDANKLLTENEN
ncbi:pro-corazonin-like isoform X2 [Tigriopus californicus]|uniref:pro-corazonin-like isoform X2 n=1 Tax=Tigriopus californicus TaxID=6832 RepID=UPI0027DA11F4|nr:pro-corazonin-like isoform X2 [Tigriopus californicus]